MEHYYILPAESGDLNSTIRKWLTALLEEHCLEALLVLLDDPEKGTGMALVNRPELLKYANPFAPVMLRNAAQMVSRITKISPPTQKTGVILRPCEERALIELVKLKQASLENIVIIGIDCPGTVPVALYPDVRDRIPREDELRLACRVCEYTSPVNADLTISLSRDSIIFQVFTDKGKELIDKRVNLQAGEDVVNLRKKNLENLKARHKEAKDELFRRLNHEIYGPDNLLKTLARCTACHNCRVMCPICYCRECFFDSSTFDREADKYLEWAGKKGGIKTPSDVLLYHLTRLNHMVASCVG